MTADEFRAHWLPLLQPLEKATGIPAMFALAQFAHEGLNGDDSVSSLASDHHNWAGLKYRDWEVGFGATPVDMPTQEVENGVAENVTDAFAHFDSDDDWLKAWAHLLQSNYGDAFAFKADPLLFAHAVYKSWATDPVALYGLANRMAWLWVPPSAQADAGPQLTRPVPIVDKTFNPPQQFRCMGWLTADGVTLAPVRAVAQSFGGDVTTDDGVSQVELKHGG